MKTGYLVMAGLVAASLAAGCNKTTTTGPGSSTATRNTNSAGQPAAKKLVLMAAKDQSIKQGEKDEVDVLINRDNFSDPVSVGFENLPAGVTMVETDPSIPGTDSKITLTLKAADDAAVGEKDVTLFASAPGVEKNTQKFKLKINKK